MKSLLLFMSLLAALGAEASVFAGATARLRIERMMTQASRDGDSNADEEEKPPFCPVMMQIESDDIIPALEEMGVQVWNRRGDILLTIVPRERLEEVLDLPGLLNADSSGELNSCMDVARPFGGYSINSGAIGKDVVVGFSDIGFDPHHIAFKDRLAAFHVYDSEMGIRKAYIGADELAEAVTDDSLHYHATHVANILAGGFMGDEGPYTGTQRMGGLYYGVASGAEIVATTSRLYDVGILCGVEDVIAYAMSVGKPCVINLSLSNHLGPHDGTDLFCRYLTRCSGDAVICLSAGNTGMVPASAGQLFNRDCEEASVAVIDRVKRTGFKVEGVTDMWSDSSEPFDTRIEIYDTDKRCIVYATDWMCFDTEDAESVKITPEDFPEWGEYMSGYVEVAGEVSGLNNRYNAAVLYEVETEEVSERGPWSRYLVAIGVRRHPDSDVYVSYFADASSSVLANTAGSPVVVGTKGSISDLCTAEGVVSVGMACARNSVPLLPEGERSWNFEPNTIVSNSAYSDMPGIKPLPHISASGCIVVSAMSGPYAAKNPEKERCAESVVDGKSYLWFPDMGTSMSSPFVAGVLASWLQFDPSLNVHDLLETAMATARKDFADISDPRWGAGCIDASAGLKKVIDDSGIVSPVADDVPERVFTLTGIDVTGKCLQPGVYVFVSTAGSSLRIVK